MSSWWARLKERYEATVAEYGRIAIGTYLVLFFGTWVAFWLAITNGIDVQGAAGGAGTVGGAYLATKLTQPVRIIATIVVTPLLVRGFRRVRPLPPEDENPAPDPS